MIGSWFRGLAVSTAVAGALVSLGCSILESPYLPKEGSFRQGEKGSFSVGQITTRDSGRCEQDGPPATGSETSNNQAPFPKCVVTGKIVLTKPTDNVSFQVFVPDGHGGARVVMCASPAEAGKTVSTSSTVAGTVSVKSVAAGVSAAQGVNENLVVLQSLDAATHYVATASYVNCLAFASGMYGDLGPLPDGTAATAIAAIGAVSSARGAADRAYQAQLAIFNNAVLIAQAAQPPVSAASASAPASTVSAVDPAAAAVSAAATATSSAVSAAAAATSAAAAASTAAAAANKAVSAVNVAIKKMKVPAPVAAASAK